MPVLDLCKLLCIVAKSNGSVKIATKAGVVQDCRRVSKKACNSFVTSVGWL